MSGQKFTSGPWLIADEDKTFVYALGPNGTNSFWAHVQSAGQERISDSEKAANARLISSAPDLLEALQMAKAEVDYQRAGHMQLRQIDRERLDHLARVYEAALSKALAA